MDTGGRVDWLQTALRHHIHRFDKETSRNRKRAFATRVTIVALGSLTTVTIALESSPLFNNSHVEPWVAAAALAFSAAVTVASACEAFFDYRWLWVSYTMTADELKSISADLEFKLADGGLLSEDDVNKLYARLQAVLKGIDKAWSRKRDEQSNPTTEKAGA